MTSASENRRPVAMRKWAVFHRFARWLRERGVTPNQVSIASVLFSTIGGIALAFSPLVDLPLATILYLITPVMMGLRGVCNLVDGLIAVEGGLKTRSGEIFNDFPDRLSDMCLFVPAGYAILHTDWGVPFGWAAACAALMTAYTRVLGGAVGSPQFFQGPMGKPMRMAVLSIACLSTLLERLFYGSTWSLLTGLGIILVGSTLTVIGRLRLIIRNLER